MAPPRALIANAWAWRCSQRRRPAAFRACSAARRSTLALTAQGLRRATDASVPNAWRGSSRTSFPMYSASDWTARARRRASTGAMASSHLTPVGRGVDMLHLPFCRTLRVFPETTQGQTAGRETRSGDFAARSRSGCVFQLRIVVTDLATASDCPHPLSDNGRDAVADSRGGYGREEEKRAPTE